MDDARPAGSDDLFDFATSPSSCWLAKHDAGSKGAKLAATTASNTPATSLHNLQPCWVEYCGRQAILQALVKSAQHWAHAQYGSAEQQQPVYSSVGQVHQLSSQAFSRHCNLSVPDPPMSLVLNLLYCCSSSEGCSSRLCGTLSDGCLAEICSMLSVGLRIYCTPFEMKHSGHDLV